MTLKGTRTAENLLKSFAGESQARMRYTYYSSLAKKEGYVEIANILLEIAEQEKEHAKRFYKFLKINKLLIIIKKQLTIVNKLLLIIYS